MFGKTALGLRCSRPIDSRIQADLHFRGKPSRSDAALADVDFFSQKSCLSSARRSAGDTVSKAKLSDLANGNWAIHFHFQQREKKNGRGRADQFSRSSG